MSFRLRDVSFKPYILRGESGKRRATLKSLPELETRNERRSRGSRKTGEKPGKKEEIPREA